MTDLIATKAFTYATRRLLPGQDFVAKTARDARLLIAIGKARRKLAAARIAPDLATNIASPVVGDVASLRSEYQAATGKRAFNGWSADQLRARIAEARQS